MGHDGASHLKYFVFRTENNLDLLFQVFRYTKSSGDRTLKDLDLIDNLLQQTDVLSRYSTGQLEII